MTLRIGLTGGMGSGKSTVAKIFEVLGVPVYYADDASKRLLDEDPGLKAALIGYFGQRAYPDGSLDREWLSEQVFSKKEKLDWLNARTHPATLRDANTWMEQQVGPYAIKEAALIFEAGAEKYLDYVIGVSSPEALRISRTMRRDGVTEEFVRRRMSKQMAEEEKMKTCDFLILNDEGSPILPQVLDLHRRLEKLAGGGDSPR